MMKNDRRYLTIKELAKLLSVTESWIKLQILKKEIPYLKFGRLVKFDLDEISRWIDERRIQEDSWN